MYQTNGKEKQANLIFSKTSLAPLKGMTIPRMELMAVLMGVRCVKFAEKQLQITISNIQIWTDSTCVLQWISNGKMLSTFVQNRVNEIKSHIDISFHYLSSNENPADVGYVDVDHKLKH